MNITLYQLTGISKTDTPVFRTRAQQVAFFDYLDSVVIETGFYPPYFKNKVTLDTSKYHLLSRYNYCSLEYNNYTYYYFIAGKRYISEDIIELDIEMDTIQTYMFNVLFINAFIDRLTIPRVFADGSINRGYIRENYSIGDYNGLYSELNYTAPIKDWFIIYRYEVPNIHVPVIPDITFTKVFATSDIKGLTNYAFGVAPFEPKAITVHDIEHPETTTEDTITPISLSYLTTDPKVTAMYLIPFQPIDEIEIQEIDDVDTLVYDFPTFVANAIEGPWSGEYYVRLIEAGGEVNIKFHTNTINPLYGFHLSTLGEPLSAGLMPVLIDENYMKLTFGDPSIRTEYPLHILTHNELKATYWADFCSGTRYYNLHEYQAQKFDNKYGTIVSNQSVFNMDLRNDPWKQYIANNRATLTGSIATTAVGAVSSFATMGLSGAAKLAVKKAEVGTRAGKLATGIANSAIDVAVEYTNLAHAPYSTRQANELLPDLLAGEGKITARIGLCDNYWEVIRIYEAYGYKVDKVVRQNLFTINNRYFYDYVKTKELHVLIGDRETEEDFISRFNDGIRMWHTTGSDLNCNDYNLIMGEVCNLDNTEVSLINGGE